MQPADLVDRGRLAYAATPTACRLATIQAAETEAPTQSDGAATRSVEQQFCPCNQ
jgi:hypothetical protein